LINIFSLIIFL